MKENLENEKELNESLYEKEEPIISSSKKETDIVNDDIIDDEEEEPIIKTVINNNLKNSINPINDINTDTNKKNEEIKAEDVKAEDIKNTDIKNDIKDTNIKNEPTNNASKKDDISKNNKNDNKTQNNNAAKKTYKPLVIPKINYKYEAEKLDTYYLFDDAVLNKIKGPKRKYIDKLVKTYNAQKTPLDKLAFLTDFYCMCQMMQDNHKLYKDKENQIKAPLISIGKGKKVNPSQFDPLVDLGEELLIDTVKSIIGNSGAKGVQKLFNYVGILRTRNHKLYGENYDKILDEIKGLNFIPKTDPNHEKKIKLIETYSSSKEYVNIDSTVSFHFQREFQDQSTKLFDWQLHYVLSLGIDENTTVEDAFKKIRALPDNLNSFLIEKKVKKDDKIMDIYRKEYPTDDPLKLFDYMKDDIYPIAVTVWGLEGIAEYKKVQDENGRTNIDNGVLQIQGLQESLKKDKDIKEWAEKFDKNNPKKYEAEVLGEKYDSQNYLVIINDLSEKLTSGKSLDVSKEPDVAKADANLALKLYDFEVTPETESVYFYNENEVLNESYKFEDELEAYVKKPDKKVRINRIKTANAQEHPMDSLYNALLFNNGDAYRDRKDLFAEPLYLKFKFPEKRDIDSKLQELILNDAFEKIIRNDGFQGIKRLYNYLGILRAKMFADFGKEWEENYKNIKEKNPELREIKANYVTQFSLSEACSMIETINGLNMTIHRFVDDKKIKWKKEFMKTIGLNNKSTVNDYINKYQQYYPGKANSILQDLKAKPEDNLYEAFKKNSTKFKTDKDVEDKLEILFADSITNIWLNEGNNLYNNQASTIEKKHILKGQRLSGINGSDIVSEDIINDSHELKKWYKNEGEKLAKKIVNQNVKTFSAKYVEVTQNKKENKFKNSEFVSDALIYEFSDTEYLKAAINALEKTGTGKSTAGWHKSNSTKYENMLGSLKRYSDAIDKGLGGEAYDLRKILVKDCLSYIDGKYAVRSNDFGQERFDIVMSVLMKNMSGTEFGIILRDINNKRSIKTKTDKGYVNEEYYRNKVEDMIGYDRGISLEQYLHSSNISKSKGILLLKGVIEALNISDSKTMEPKSEEYRNFVKALNKYENAVFDKIEDKAALEQKMVQTAINYVINNCKLPMKDYQQERFEASMIILRKYTQAKDFKALIEQINAKRGATKEGKKGHLKDTDFTPKSNKKYEALVSQLYDKQVEAEKKHRNSFSENNIYYKLYNKIYRTYMRNTNPAFNLSEEQKAQNLIKNIKSTLPNIGDKGDINEADFVTIAYAGSLTPEAQLKGYHNDSVDGLTNVRVFSEKHTLDVFDSNNHFYRKNECINSIQAGREIAVTALEQYAKGNKAPLAKVLINAIKMNKSKIDTAGFFNDNMVVLADLTVKTLGIIEKDKELLKIAKREGLNEELINFSTTCKEVTKIYDAAFKSKKAYLKDNGLLVDKSKEAQQERKMLLVDIISAKLIDYYMDKNKNDREANENYINDIHSIDERLNANEINADTCKVLKNDLKYKYPGKNPILDNLHNKGAVEDLKKTVENIIKINKLETIHPEKVDYNLGKRDYVANLIQSISKTKSKKKPIDKTTVEKKTETKLNK